MTVDLIPPKGSQPWFRPPHTFWIEDKGPGDIWGGRIKFKMQQTQRVDLSPPCNFWLQIEAPDPDTAWEQAKAKLRGFIERRECDALRLVWFSTGKLSAHAELPVGELIYFLRTGLVHARTLEKKSF